MQWVIQMALYKIHKDLVLYRKILQTSTPRYRKTDKNNNIYQSVLNCPENKILWIWWIIRIKWLFFLKMSKNAQWLNKHASKERKMKNTILPNIRIRLRRVGVAQLAAKLRYVLNKKILVCGSSSPLKQNHGWAHYSIMVRFSWISFISMNFILLLFSILRVAFMNFCAKCKSVISKICFETLVFQFNSGTVFSLNCKPTSFVTDIGCVSILLMMQQ